MLDENPDRAFYGLKHVQLAHANQAIETLLITDELFRYFTHSLMLYQRSLKDLLVLSMSD
jgi:stalled ribosome rescue protein Dom34